MALPDVVSQLVSIVAHVVGFWVGLRLIRLAIDLRKQDVPAPYTIAVADFKKARQFMDWISLGLGIVGAAVCFIVAISLVNSF